MTIPEQLAEAISQIRQWQSIADIMQTQLQLSDEMIAEQKEFITDCKTEIKRLQKLQFVRTDN